MGCGFGGMRFPAHTSAVTFLSCFMLVTPSRVPGAVLTHCPYALQSCPLCMHRKAISLVHVGPGAHIKQVQEWQEPLHLQDVDWQRSVLYGTDDHVTLLRVVGHPGRREAIVTGLPGETLWGDRGHPPLPDAP